MNPSQSLLSERISLQISDFNGKDLLLLTPAYHLVYPLTFFTISTYFTGCFAGSEFGVILPVAGLTASVFSLYGYYKFRQLKNHTQTPLFKEKYTLCRKWSRNAAIIGSIFNIAFFCLAKTPYNCAFIGRSINR